MRGKRPTWYMNSACSKMVLKMVENSSRSLIFKDAVYSLKRMRKMKKKVEESDMMSNIFDDVNLGNIADEPGSHLQSLMHLQHELLLIYGSGDWMNIRAIETVRVWHTFGGTLLCEHGPCCSLEGIKN